MSDNSIEILATNTLLLTGLSIASLIIASVLGAWYVGKLPADYFVSESRQRPHDQRWLQRVILSTIKNIVGIALIVAGVIMLFTPGQGLLTLVIGVLMTNFPGKFALERRLASRPSVSKALNWMRAKRSKTPFLMPD